MLLIMSQERLLSGEGGGETDEEEEEERGNHSVPLDGIKKRCQILAVKRVCSFVWLLFVSPQRKKRRLEPFSAVSETKCIQ